MAQTLQRTGAAIRQVRGSLEDDMSLNIAGSGLATASQLLNSLLSQIYSKPSAGQTSSNTPPPAQNDFSKNTLTGTSKPSLNSSVLSTMMQLQQDHESNGDANFLAPAIRNVDSQPQITLSSSLSTGATHNNMLRAFEPGQTPDTENTFSINTSSISAVDDSEDFSNSEATPDFGVASTAVFGG